LGQTGPQGRLARRGLALTSLQHVTHDHFVDLVGLDARALHGRLDGDRAQFVSGQIGQTTHHAAHRGAGDRDDDNGISHERLLVAKRRPVRAWQTRAAADLCYTEKYFRSDLALPASDIETTIQAPAILHGGP